MSQNVFYAVIVANLETSCYEKQLWQRNEKLFKHFCTGFARRLKDLKLRFPHFTVLSYCSCLLLSLLLLLLLLLLWTTATAVNNTEALCYGVTEFKKMCRF